MRRSAEAGHATVTNACPCAFRGSGHDAASGVSGTGGLSPLVTTITTIVLAWKFRTSMVLFAKSGTEIVLDFTYPP